jgi:hypothetical protein
MSDLVLYTSNDGRTRLDLRIEGRTVWLTQLEIAELFQTTKQNVSLHAKNIFADGELSPEATVKESLTVQNEGNREVKRTIAYYNLDLILAIGYRVRSPRGTQFRQWATTHLREFLVKGFVMDDQRLKDPKGWDYFDELLARIREIRASEKRFYQKVRDLFALSSDYAADDSSTQIFFAEVQNKLHFAATGLTAAEIIVCRADPDQANMSLTNWSGSRVRKHDVIIAKNYLTEDEIDTLNRLVVIFLEQAELLQPGHGTLAPQALHGLGLAAPLAEVQVDAVAELLRGGDQRPRPHRGNGLGPTPGEQMPPHAHRRTPIRSRQCRDCAPTATPVHRLGLRSGATTLRNRVAESPDRHR